MVNKLLSMRDNIEEAIGDILKGHYWNIRYGYDCISITINSDTPIFFDVFEKLKEKFDNDGSMCLSVVEGDIVVICDISNIILEEFGSWENYEKLLEEDAEWD